MITQAFVIAWHFSPQLGSLYDIFGISVVDNRLSATHLGLKKKGSGRTFSLVTQLLLSNLQDLNPRT